MVQQIFFLCLSIYGLALGSCQTIIDTNNNDTDEIYIASFQKALKKEAKKLGYKEVLQLRDHDKAALIVIKHGIEDEKNLTIERNKKKLKENNQALLSIQHAYTNNNEIDLLRKLLTTNIYWNSTEKHSLFHKAIFSEATKIASACIRLGIDLESQTTILHIANKTKYHASPLYIAATLNQKVLVGRLLRAGANIDSLSEKQFRPLETAIYHNAVETVQYLLHYRDKNSNKIYQDTAIKLARTDTMRLFLRNYFQGDWIKDWLTDYYKNKSRNTRSENK